MDYCEFDRPTIEYTIVYQYYLIISYGVSRQQQQQGDLADTQSLFCFQNFGVLKKGEHGNITWSCF